MWRIGALWIKHNLCSVQQKRTCDLPKGVGVQLPHESNNSLLAPVSPLSSSLPSSLSSSVLPASPKQHIVHRNHQKHHPHKAHHLDTKSVVMCGKIIYSS